jgi:hypothetical protein
MHVLNVLITFLKKKKKKNSSTFFISKILFFFYRTVTHILHFEGNGKVEFFEGNWLQYEKERRKRGVGVDFADDEDVFRSFSFDS